MLDATVLFAGIGWPRWSYEILRHAAREDFRLVLTARIIAQARRNLQMKVPGAVSLLDAWLATCPCETAEEPSAGDVSTHHSLMRQPEDIPIALAAINAGVDYFVSEDKDFTAQDQTTADLRRRLVIMRPVIFLREVMGWSSEALEVVRQRNWNKSGGAQGDSRFAESSKRFGARRRQGQAQAAKGTVPFRGLRVISSVSCSDGSGSRVIRERVVLRALQRAKFDVYVERGPVQLVGRGAAHGVNLRHGRIAELRVVREGHEVLAVVNQQPEAVQRDVGDFTHGSGGAKWR